MVPRFLAPLCVLFATPVQAEVILACSFPDLPSVVMRFPDGADAEKTMAVGDRPPVVLVEGQGEGRLITASVDGYDFRFAPANSTLDVEKDGTVLRSQAGSCVTIGGPENPAPLEIAAPLATTVEPATSDPVADALPEDPGKWIVSEDKSAFDDTRTVVLSVESNEVVRGQFGPPGPAMLYIRCMENTTVTYLWLNDLFLSDLEGFGAVDYRLDEREATSVRMTSSTDNKALGLWDGGSSIPFVKELIESSKIVLRATPFNESPVEFSFDLAGIQAAITPLREACVW